MVQNRQVIKFKILMLSCLEIKFKEFLAAYRFRLIRFLEGAPTKLNWMAGMAQIGRISMEKWTILLTQTILQ